MMQTLNPVKALAIRVSVAHLFGLLVVGFYDTIGTTAGFGSDAGFVAIMAAIVSLPWFAVLLIVVGLFAERISRHIVLFAVLGTTTVVGSWWLIGGGVDLLDEVFLASGTAGSLFIVLSYGQKLGWSRAGQGSDRY